MNIKVGCRGFAVKEKEYAEKLSLVELDETYSGFPAEQKLKEWAEDMPAGFEFVVRAPRGISDWSRIDPEKAADIWNRTRAVSSALGAEIIMFSPPDSFIRTESNLTVMERFLHRIDRKGIHVVWEAPRCWKNAEVTDVSRDNGIIPAIDPFKDAIPEGPIRYLNLPGIDSAAGRYKGLELKKIRDLLENETEREGDIPTYVIFSNSGRFHDAMRFRWIVRNTGRVREIDEGMLKALCVEIEEREEDENVQALSREAERIVSLILFTEYKKVDIEIESRKLKELCKKLFPEKEYLYDMIYGGRFERLWEQFREEGEAFE